ncbi:MAG: sigma 54-interacting transcriptional regulator [Desulfobacterales bacterium]|nr:sigma 54-interacting transcriptional regulator [Desulfobacterales bacterium]
MLDGQSNLELILEKMDEGVALVDDSNRLCYANSDFARMLNLSVRDCLDLSVSALFSEIDFQSQKQGAWQYSLIKGLDVRLTPLSESDAKKGNLLQVREPEKGSFSFLPFFSGTTPCTVALDSVKEGIIIVNHDARVLFFNKTQLKCDGFSLDKVKGRYTWELYDVRPSMSTLWKVLNTGLPVNDFIQYYRRKNGRYARAHGDSYPVRMNNRVVGAVAVYHELNDTGNEIIKIIEMDCRKFTPSVSGINKTDKTKLDNDKTKGGLFTFQDILGTSNAFRHSLIKAEKAGSTASPVMLSGETGTGKEMFAQSIHSASPRKDKPFLALNCAAIPENLIEGILFGTRKGVYTGASERTGLFQEADGGTFFLDELNSMPLSVQGKLLRVLEEGRIRPLGGTREKKIDVRIISSCNQKFHTLLNENILREDLFYRLAVVTVEIPPLRDRREDIRLLVDRFIDYFNKALNKRVEGVSSSYMKQLFSWEWPGNVRQLKHCIEYSMNMIADNRYILDEPELPEYFHKSAQQNKGFEQGHFESEMNLSESGAFLSPERDLSAIIYETEKNDIVKALLHCRGNVSQAAKHLGIKRGALYYRMRKYKIK